MTQSSPSGGSQGTKTTASNTRQAQVNVQELTERVYKLFLADLEVQKKRIHGSRR